MFLRLIRYLVSVSLCSFIVFPNALLADYSKNDKAIQMIEELVKDHGFDKAELISLFSEAERKESILEAISRPAEKRLEWFEYRKIFITKDRIKKGHAFLEQYAEVLTRAESEFGVPKEIITAIIGVETRYGSNKGSYRVLDALATLGFDYPPRAKFFSSELKQALILAKEQGFNMREIKGSYAGAMGYGQFIPSSYRHYAIDFDGDKVVDILDNPIDAIGSVANYFVKHRWQPKQAIAYRLDSDESKAVHQEFTSKSLKPSYELSTMIQKGVAVPESLPSDAFGKIQTLMLADGQEDWLTLHNFYVITRYNHSHMYAMAVYQLAKELGLAL